MVGVFVDVPLPVVRAAKATAGLDLLQLHGSEGPDVVAALAPGAFKAVAPRMQREAEEMLATYATNPPTPPCGGAEKGSSAHPNLLVDAYAPTQHGGTGRQADMSLARWMASRCRLLLAGGLTPANVTDAIHHVHPWGVDVSSGVEVRQGIKDHTLIHAFVEAVRVASP
jgi:phosphoribosylanthranilate isomerase